MQAVSPLLLFQDDAVLSTGTADVSADQSDGTIDLVILLSDDSVSKQWTLTQTIDLEGDILYVSGTLVVFDIWSGTTTLTGGWTYSPVDGVQEYPDSDPGFHDEVAGMFACADGGATAGVACATGLNLADTIKFIANLATMAVNYILDLFIPYEPATSCDGPLIKDGPGQSCEHVNIPCVGKFSNMCKKIDELPGVSNAFKQCMQGRCGCGGSHHKRLKISCADKNDCGPCAALGGPYGGCNIAGSNMWYCSDTTDPCRCANIVFHEMSHACGSMDLQNSAPLDSYRIGDWFEDQYEDQFGCGDSTHGGWNGREEPRCRPRRLERSTNIQGAK